jgi:hypothetical protein
MFAQLAEVGEHGTMAKPVDLTVQILREILDEVKQTNAPVDQMNR